MADKRQKGNHAQRTGFRAGLFLRTAVGVTISTGLLLQRQAFCQKHAPFCQLPKVLIENRLEISG